MTAPRVFQLTLHHLDRDAARAGIEFPEIKLEAVTAEQLRDLLNALAALAPGVAYPVQPELRIRAPDGQFLVQVKEGQVRFSNWSIRSGASDLTPDEIFAAITGLEPPAPKPKISSRLSGGLGGGWRHTKPALLAAAILGANGLTAWMLTRPPPDLLLPAYELVEDAAAGRILADFAGVYETGAGEGDRRLKIAADGAVRWEKFGVNRSVVEESSMTTQAVRVAGQPALLTSERAIIELKDPITVVMYGDMYRRAAR